MSKHAEIGISLLSLLSAILHKRGGDDVLLVNQGSTLINDFTNHYLSSWEAMAFQNVGSRFEIEPLSAIDEYLTLSPYYICFQGIFIELGRDPATNLIEILRKYRGHYLSYPFLKIDEERDLFNMMYYQYEIQLTSLLTNSRDQSFNLKILKDFMPKTLQYIYTDFFNLYKDTLKPLSSSKSLFSFFCNQIRIHTQSVHKVNMDEQEFLFFFLTLLAPRYHLNYSALLDSLQKIAIASKIDSVEANVSSLSLHKASPHSILLSDFIGTRLVDYVTFYNDSLFDVGLTFDRFEGLFQKVEIVLEAPCSYQRPWFLASTFFIESDPSRFPYLSLSIKGHKNRLIASFFIPYEECSKIEFMKKMVEETFLSYVKQKPEIYANYKIVDTHFCSIICVEDRALKRPNALFTQSKSLLYVENSPMPLKTTHIRYRGEYNLRPLGLISILLTTIKEAHP